MYALDEAPTLPRGEQARNGVSQSVLEGRHNDAACRAGHTLHIARNKGSSDAVSFADALPCDDNGSVRTDKLRKALGLVKVNSFFCHRKFVSLPYVRNVYSTDVYSHRQGRL